MNITSTNYSQPWPPPAYGSVKVTTRIDIESREWPGKLVAWYFDRALNSVEHQAIYTDPSEENMRRMGGTRVQL